jgi:hypothetical protein
MPETAKRRTRTKAPGVYRSISGKYEIAYRDSDGRLRFQVVDGDLEAAKAARADVVSRLAKGERLSRTKVTFAEYAKTWLAAQKTEIRPRTYEVYEIAIRLHLDPVVGHMKLSDIDEDDVLRVIAKMKADGKKPWTIRSVLTPLGRILGHAARKGKISSNPMQRLSVGSGRRSSAMRCASSVARTSASCSPAHPRGTGRSSRRPCSQGCASANSWDSSGAMSTSLLA